MKSDDNLLTQDELLKALMKEKLILGADNMDQLEKTVAARPGGAEGPKGKA